MTSARYLQGSSYREPFSLPFKKRVGSPSNHHSQNGTTACTPPRIAARRATTSDKPSSLSLLEIPQQGLPLLGRHPHLTALRPLKLALRYTRPPPKATPTPKQLIAPAFLRNQPIPDLRSRKLCPRAVKYFSSAPSRTNDTPSTLHDLTIHHRERSVSLHEISPVQHLAFCL